MLDYELISDELAALDQERLREQNLLRKKYAVRDALIRHQRTPKNSLERVLWIIAKRSPFGGLIAPSYTDPYLSRTYLTPDGMRIHVPSKFKLETDKIAGTGARPYLHFFFRGDADKELHNHPWRISYSLILSGGYTEFKLNDETGKVEKRIFLPGSINVIRRDDFHRVELLDEVHGCWTLFVSVDRLGESDGKDWGFKDPVTGQYTPWGEFVHAKSQV